MTPEQDERLVTAVEKAARALVHLAHATKAEALSLGNISLALQILLPPLKQVTPTPTADAEREAAEREAKINQGYDY